MSGRSISGVESLLVQKLSCYRQSGSGLHQRVKVKRRYRSWFSTMWRIGERLRLVLLSLRSDKVQVVLVDFIQSGGAAKLLLCVIDIEYNRWWSSSYEVAGETFKYCWCDMLSGLLRWWRLSVSFFTLYWIAV